MSRSLVSLTRLKKLSLTANCITFVRSNSTVSSTSLVETDSCSIPLKPTWSVNELLSSYPKPIITPQVLQKLHNLSALIPPDEGTVQHAKLTTEMESLVKLVEAVKVVDVGRPSTSREGDVPDGRIWAEEIGIKLEREEAVEGEAHGRDLLHYASRTEDGLYVVDADRSR